MSATVILAETRQEAQEAAQNLGIRRNDYIYPARPEMLRGVRVGRVVWVSGWAASPAITTDTLQLLQSHLLPEVVEIEQPTSTEWWEFIAHATPDLDGLVAEMILSGHFAATFAPEVSPFLDYQSPVERTHRREPWWRRLFKV